MGQSCQHEHVGASIELVALGSMQMEQSIVHDQQRYRAGLYKLSALLKLKNVAVAISQYARLLGLAAVSSGLRSMN